MIQSTAWHVKIPTILSGDVAFDAYCPASNVDCRGADTYQMLEFGFESTKISSNIVTKGLPINPSYPVINVGSFILPISTLVARFTIQPSGDPFTINNCNPLSDMETGVFLGTQSIKDVPTNTTISWNTQSGDT